LAKAVAKASAAPSTKKILPSIPWWMWIVLLMVIVNVGKISHYISQTFYKYTYEEAKTYCEERDKVLPKDISELIENKREIPQGISVWSHVDAGQIWTPRRN